MIWLGGTWMMMMMRGEYEDDLLKPERLLQRTDRSAGWHHVQQLMHLTNLFDLSLY
ncbi:unnamed protein product [Brassica napus]|uniref:(rape) hypothetical protein n=1 Tax=Brassica napus TaxID=3708 RepID=A0A817ARE9_BRANA|nr:unnamed protein product [Brassica napus]